MAIRTKTIEYTLLQQAAQVASAVSMVGATISLAIPETTGRTFRSVYVEVWGNHATANITDVAIELDVGGVNDTGPVFGTVHTGTGEDFTTIHLADFTSHFVSNYSGTSTDAVLTVSFTGPGSNVAGAKIYITYDYDDSASTQIHTVKLFIGSDLGTLASPTSAFSVPDLDALLPETSIVYRDVFFVLRSVHSSNSVDSTVQARLDAEGFATLAVVEGSSKLDTRYTLFYSRNDMDTSVVHTVEFQDTTSVGLNHASVELVVTYEYANSSTTQAKTVTHFLGQEPTAGGTSLISQLQSIRVAEDSPSLLSGYVHLNFSTAKVNGTGTIGVNAFSTRVYTLNILQKDCGQDLLHDFTSDVTLVKGDNSIELKVTPSIASLVNGLGSYVTFTYSYNASTSTVFCHTVAYFAAQALNNSADNVSGSVTISVPEGGNPSGFVRGYVNSQLLVQGTFSATITIDDLGDQVTAFGSNKESLLILASMPIANVLVPADIADSHTYKIVISSTPITPGLVIFLTYQTKSGTISGVTRTKSGAALGTCEVSLFKTIAGAPPTYEFQESQISDGSGNYSFNIFDDVDYMVRAQKDGAPNTFDTTDNEVTQTPV